MQLPSKDFGVFLWKYPMDGRTL